jgi:hypothetical protein
MVAKENMILKFNCKNGEYAMVDIRKRQRWILVCYDKDTATLRKGIVAIEIPTKDMEKIFDMGI